MPSSTTVPFDSIAKEYDEVFSTSLIGRHQREIVRKFLHQFLAGKQGLKILEINCGTGEDALWLASLGHRVIATDQSENMISIAQQKTNSNIYDNNPHFCVCGFEDLSKTFSSIRFDLIFSNFSGLNCVGETELLQLNKQLCPLLYEDGHLATVIFGKYTWWETSYFLLKANTTDAVRRWSNNKVLAKLSDKNFQATFYYSICKFSSLFNKFKLVQRKPVGLFIPPSYLENYFKKNSLSFKLLISLEERAGNMSALSCFADHVYLLFKKK